MNKVEELIKLIRTKFADNNPAPAPAPAPAPSPAPAPAPAPPAGNTTSTAQYDVDGGVPVFVNIADDNIADIDQGDSVFTDAACTAPYPDGTYKVTGTDFSFTVAGGVVTAVVDPDGKGAGTPKQDTPPAPPAPDFSTPEAMRKEFEKFGSDTPSLQTLAAMVKAIFENVFQWQLRDAKEKEAIAAYQESFQKQDETIKEQATKLQKQEEIIKGLFELVEELSKVPKDNPVETPKTGFNRQSFESKEKKLDAIAKAAKELKEKK